jgi:hypothetical protein
VVFDDTGVQFDNVAVLRDCESAKGCNRQERKKTFVPN